MVITPTQERMSLSLGVAIAIHALILLAFLQESPVTLENQVRSARHIVSITLPTIQTLTKAITDQPKQELTPVEPVTAVAKEAQPIVKKETTTIQKKTEAIPFTNKWQTQGVRTPPAYPKRALRLRQEGTVLLSAVLDEAGKIAQLRLKESSFFPLLDQAAMDAVKQWSFLPSEINGQIQKVRIDIPIEFKIQAHI